MELTNYGGGGGGGGSLRLLRNVNTRIITRNTIMAPTTISVKRYPFSVEGVVDVDVSVEDTSVDVVDSVVEPPRNSDSSKIRRRRVPYVQNWRV